jgi:hypothetical protein
VSDTRTPSAWKPLVDAWIEREQQLRPQLPVQRSSVAVRDAVEVGDHAYVLVSYEVDSPWPAEEDLAGATHQTAIIEAARVRQPWIEHDATRSRTSWQTADGLLVVHEHVLGGRRAWSGQAPAGASEVILGFDDADAQLTATVIDGWYLCVVDGSQRLRRAGIDVESLSRVEPVELAGMLPTPSFERAGADAMYFSPLDLRMVHPVVQWQRHGSVVVVATCIEQYDEGGMVRLRIDGTRADDDTFVTWPHVELSVDGVVLGSAVCGEYSLADTISLDVGFRPWLPAGAERLVVSVRGVRGVDGEVAPIELVCTLNTPSS